MQSVREREWWRRSPTAHGEGFNTASNSIASGRTDTCAAEQESNFPFYALLLFTFILLLAPQQILPVLAPLRIAMLSILLAVSALVATRLAHGQPIMPYPPGVVFALMLAVWAVMSIPMSMWPGGSLAFLLEKYLKTITVFLLLVSVINTSKRLRQMCVALVIMAIPLAWTAISNLLSGVTMSGGGERIIGYEASLAQNPNDMALLMNLLLPLAIGLFLSAKNSLRKMLFAGLVALIVIAIIATFSRAGFLTLAVTFGCYLVLLRHRPQRFFAPLLLIVVVVALPLIPGDYLGRVGTITNLESDTTNSAQIRLRDYIAAAKLVFDNPIIGTGIGTNMLAMNEVRGATWTEIHNVYLLFSVELGLPGLLLFIMLLVASIRSSQAMLNRIAGQEQFVELYCIAEGLKVSLLAFCVAALFHPVAYQFFFYYIAGLAIALGQINVADTFQKKSTKSRVRS